MDYDEATAIRRATRLVQNSQPSFGLLNCMVIIVLMLLVMEAIASIF